MAIPDPTPAEIVYAWEVPVRDAGEEGIDIVETPSGAVFMRMVSNGGVMMMTPTNAENLQRLGGDLIAAAHLADSRARQRARRWIAGSN